MFSHCRGWRQVCEILLTALKLHALTWNQDSAYICVLLYLLTWAFETIQKLMKLLAENQFPRCSTVSLTVVLSTWDNNRFYLIILFYLIRVEGVPRMNTGGDLRHLDFDICLIFFARGHQTRSDQRLINSHISYFEQETFSVQCKLFLLEWRGCDTKAQAN